MKFFIFSFIIPSILLADIASTKGSIQFYVDSNKKVAQIDTRGLSLGTTSSHSSNLFVQGNAIVTQELSIGTQNTSNSNLHLSGTMGYNVHTISDNQDILNSTMNLVNTQSGNIVVDLPYAGNVSNRVYTLKKMSPSYDLLIHGGGNQIDLYDQILIEENGTMPDAIQFISNGQQWYILNQPSQGVQYISGYQPSDNNLALWLDAADISTLSLSNGNVSQWSDKSGQGDHAIQASSNMQPIYQDQALVFDGIKSLKVSNISNLSTWSTNRTIAVMLTYTGTASNTILHWGAAASSFRDEQFVVSGNEVQLLDGHNSGSPSITSTSSDNALNGMCLIYQTEVGANYDRIFRANGKEHLNQSGTRTSNISPDQALFIGHDLDGTSYRNEGSFATGLKLHEILIFDESLSLTNLQKIEGYLMHKWDREHLLEEQHPYRYRLPD